MDERKTLLSYIGPGWVLALAALLLLFAALFCGLYRPPVEEVKPVYPPPIPSGSPAFAAGEEAGQLVYLDTIAVSDAICENGDGRYYYAVEDDGHLFRIVCVSGETYALMAPQRALWNDPSAEPSSFRLTGRRAAVPAEVKQGFLTVFNMESATFDAYFGGLCLVEEVPAVETPTRSPVWGVFCVLFALGFLAVLALWLSRALPCRAAFLRLEESERLEEAARQLDDPETGLVQGDRLRLARDFVFGWRSGLAAAWEDVGWCYERNLGFGSTSLARVLVIRTTDGYAHPLFFSGKEPKELRRLANSIAERCPQMLWGLTAENRAAWKNRLL